MLNMLFVLPIRRPPAAAIFLAIPLIAVTIPLPPLVFSIVVILVFGVMPMIPCALGLMLP